MFSYQRMKEKHDDKLLLPKHGENIIINNALTVIYEPNEWRHQLKIQRKKEENLILYACNASSSHETMK